MSWRTGCGWSWQVSLESFVFIFIYHCSHCIEVVRFLEVEEIHRVNGWMKLNKIFTQFATRCAGACCRSAVSGVSQARSALLASAPCAKYSVFWQPLSSFTLGSFFYPHPSAPPPPLYFPLINQCDKCLVPLPWGFVARRHGLSATGA